ncbi:MAG TPA: hypothetical protein VN704_09585 [Verrucomicrobiae bacterium]|nr:hypothetical protein [Verrucomicrobiae bacterium]
MGSNPTPRAYLGDLYNGIKSNNSKVSAFALMHSDRNIVRNENNEKENELYILIQLILSLKAVPSHTLTKS